MQMRIIDLCEGSAPPAMEQQDMSFVSYKRSHILCKVPAEPVQHNNDIVYLKLFKLLLSHTTYSENIKPLKYFVSV